MRFPFDLQQIFQIFTSFEPVPLHFVISVAHYFSHKPSLFWAKRLRPIISVYRILIKTWLCTGRYFFYYICFVCIFLEFLWLYLTLSGLGAIIQNGRTTISLPYSS